MKHAAFIVLAISLVACGTNAPTVDTPAPTPPTIDSFTSSPPTIAAAGQPATLNWSISGSYDTLQLTDSVSTNVLNVSGTSFTVYPNQTITYRLTATGGGGTTSSETTVALQGTDPTPQPTPTPPPETPPTNPNPPTNPAKPKINSFRAVQGTIEAGGTVGLQWSVSGADTLLIDNGVGTVTGTSVVVMVNQTTTYKLTATNVGGSVSATATVKVKNPTSNVPYYGRWIVTFRPSGDGPIAVHELDIYTAINTSGQVGGVGKHLFCHENLEGKVCSTFNAATGDGFIGSRDGATVLALDSNAALLNGDRALLSGNLSSSKTTDGNDRLEGNATYYVGEDNYPGTVSAVNLGKPRSLE